MVAAVELARSGSPEEMVTSLGWLALDHDQAGHLLVQANSVVRKLLLDGDTDRARAAAAMVPGDTGYNFQLILSNLCFRRWRFRASDERMERSRRRRTARRSSKRTPRPSNPPHSHGGFQRLVRPLPQRPTCETSAGRGGKLHREGGARAEGEGLPGGDGEVARWPGCSKSTS